MATTDVGTSTEPADATSKELRRNALGVPGVSFFVLSGNGPVAALVAGAPLVFLTIGAASPAIYVISAALYLVFCPGYVAMSRYAGNATGYVSYIARALGRPAGASGMITALVMYVAVQCSMVAGFSLFAHETFASLFDIHIAWQIWALGAAALVGVLAYNKWSSNSS